MRIVRLTAVECCSVY